MSRKPDFVLKAMDKDTDEKARVGAAWQNKNGSVSIGLDSFVVLSARSSLVLTLFPIGPDENTAKDD